MSGELLIPVALLGGLCVGVVQAELVPDAHGWGDLGHPGTLQRGRQQPEGTSSLENSTWAACPHVPQSSPLLLQKCLGELSLQMLPSPLAFLMGKPKHEPRRTGGTEGRQGRPLLPAHLLLGHPRLGMGNSPCVRSLVRGRVPGHPLQ